MITSYKDLPIASYDAIVSIMNSTDSDDSKDLQILSILSGLSISDLLNLSTSEISSLQQKAQFLMSPSDSPKVSKFRFKGYKFHVRGLDSISYAQFVDLKSASTYVEMLSALLVPDKHQYNDGTYSVDFSSLSTATALSIINFFLQASLNRSIRSLRFSVARPQLSREERHCIQQCLSCLSQLRFRV